MIEMCEVNGRFVPEAEVRRRAAQAAARRKMAASAFKSVICSIIASGACGALTCLLVSLLTGSAPTVNGYLIGCLSPVVCAALACLVEIRPKQTARKRRKN